MAAAYYSFDNGDYMFYSPTDIAMVRERWRADVAILTSDARYDREFYEPAGNYAKYLNDVVMNDLWDSDRGPHWATWATTGLYQDPNTNYSRWAFDARNYFTYPAGDIDVTIDWTDPTNPTISSMSIAGGEDAGYARNRMAIVESNEVTGYTYIPNPPFRHLFDLFKVIDDAQLPESFEIADQGGYYQLEVEPSGDVDEDFSTTNQVFSGPSVFRYEARWDDQRCEFLPIANYLDDIAPYVTCRSYVFRVEANGAVTASGGAGGAVVDTARFSRDRSKTAVVDVGPLWARRDAAPVLDDVQQGAGYTARDRNRTYRILWYKDESR
jgi:hypothetical protein